MKKVITTLNDSRLSFQTYYHGRKWDAPFTDDSVAMPEELAEVMLGGQVACTWCSETLLATEDVFVTPTMAVHLECYLRSGMGDVAHLEGRCTCGNPVAVPGEEDQTYRQQAKATMQWLLDHNRGRFHDE